MEYYNETDYYFQDYLFIFYFNNSDTMTGEINYKCQGLGASTVWTVIKIIVVATGLPINITLLWMLIDGWKGQLRAQILSLSMCFMALLYCSCLPLDICTYFMKFSGTVISTSEAFSILNFVGCPLHASTLCLERYIAVGWPVLYLKLRKSQHRLFLSVLVWILTVALAIFVYITNLQAISQVLTITITVLYLLMLICLGGIIFILCKKGPGDNERDTPQKRKALINILALLCPFSIAYLPILSFAPIQNLSILQNYSPKDSCFIFQMVFSFPNFGVYIGPVFFLSRFKQLSCFSRASGQTQTHGRATESPSHCVVTGPQSP